MTEVIRTDTLTKKYRSVAALDHVNLEVQEGAIYALVGQNGAGKTTAIKILMNLIPASQGTAQVLGTDSRKIRGQAYTQIGYVSENQEIPEWMKVGALLDYLRDFYPTYLISTSLVKQLNLSATLILSFAINSPKAFSSAPPNLLSSSPPTTSPK